MNTEKSTLTRVREAQEALDKARSAMDSVQGGLATVESMAKKAESAREHPVRTGGIVLVMATVALGVLIGIKSVNDND